MSIPLQRITLGDISDVLEKNKKGKLEPSLHLGDAHVCLSWRKEGHIKIALPDRRQLLLPIPYYRTNGLSREEAFTPHGFLNVVDNTLKDEKYYLARLTFLGYAGFFRYPALKGTLYKGCGFPNKP